MKITLAWLKKNNACEEGIEYCEAKGFIGLPIKEFARKLIKADKLDWANWLIIRILQKPDTVKYAVFAAELVLPIFEKKYPNDDMPRKAIEAAKQYKLHKGKKIYPDMILSYKAAEAAAEAAYLTKYTVRTDLNAYFAVKYAIHAISQDAYNITSAAIYPVAAKINYIMYPNNLYVATEAACREADIIAYTAYQTIGDATFKKILEGGLSLIKED